MKSLPREEEVKKLFALVLKTKVKVRDNVLLFQKLAGWKREHWNIDSVNNCAMVRNTNNIREISSCLFYVDAELNCISYYIEDVGFPSISDLYQGASKIRYKSPLSHWRNNMRVRRLNTSTIRKCCMILRVVSPDTSHVWEFILSIAGLREEVQYKDFVYSTTR